MSAPKKRQPWWPLACALLVGCAAHDVATGAGQAQPNRDGLPLVLGTRFTLDSQVLHEAREVNVWLPPDYETSGERYDVLYLLDGGAAQDFPHIAGLGQLGALSWTYRSLIIVGVASVDRKAELTPPARSARFQKGFPQAGGAARFREFLAREVRPFVEARFRTGPRRAVMGESLAGLFVVDTFLEAPDTFDDYVAVSPSLWWDEQRLAAEAPALLSKHGESKRRLYLAVGDEGGTMRAAVDALVKALVAAPPKGLAWHFDDRARSETHATIYHPAALAALRWLYALPAEDDGGQDPWFMTVDQPPP
jgi:uncharacterized protein